MPLKPPTLLDYDRRIARAMEWLAANPDREPSLEALAAAAAFSPCHFHRIYRALAGETPAATLARMRLQRAAADLLRTALPISRLARQAGYGSEAAFNRAFRVAHGLPPAAYRRQGGIGQRIRPQPTEETTMFDVTLGAMPALRLAVTRHTGPYMEVGRAFERMESWGQARGLLGPETRFFGLYYDDPHSVPAAQLRADAGFTVAPDVAVEGEEPRILELPATEAASIVFQGPYAELEPAYNWLYREWLPKSGREPADLPAMENYLNDCRALPPTEWLTRIILPLKPA